MIAHSCWRPMALTRLDAMTKGGQIQPLSRLESRFDACVCTFGIGVAVSGAHYFLSSAADIFFLVHSGPLLRLLDVRPAEGSTQSEGEGRRSAGGDVSAEREGQGAGRDCGTEGERTSSAPTPAVCLPATGR